MTSKYARFDNRLFAWLRKHRAAGTEVTTAAVIAELAISDKANQRHVSRRFTQLEDRGVLLCRLHGTTRICSVVNEVPSTLAKCHWRSRINKDVRNTAAYAEAGHQEVHAHLPPTPSIRARDSNEFEAAGGTIERIPTQWDTRCTGSQPLGDSFTFDE